MGELYTLRLVAEYAETCNLFDIPDGGTIKRKLAVLARHCEQAGRSFNAIEKTISIRFDPDEPAHRFTEHLAILQSIGIEHAVVITSRPWTEGTVTRLAAAAPPTPG
jgi:hypothetical protein